MTPQNKKYATYAVAGTAGLAILFLVTRKKTETGGTPYDPTGNGPINTPVFNANTTAMKLLDAMKEMGTNEAAIFKTLTSVNQSQFGQVITAFKKRQYNKTTGNQYNYLPFYTLPYLGLVEWLENELSEENYSTLRQRYPNYL